MEEKDKEKQQNEKNETDTDDNTKLVEEALKSFCCYLYVGKGHHYYKAKPWNDDESYPISERLQCLEILAANKKTELVPIDKIKLAMDSGLIRTPENLMFALAMCSRQKQSEKLRAAAYYFLAEHCKEWKYFISFIKYNSILSKMDVKEDETSKHSGTGHGWKNAVNKWYLTQSPTSLTQLVTHHKGSYGWKHKDILKLSHPDTAGLEVEKRAIVCYIVRGLEEAQKEYGSDPEAKKILDYIGSVEIFKRCENPETVVESIKTGKFTIDQVHPKALKSKEVWLALLEGMDVRTILKSVPKLNKLGLLTNETPAMELVIRSLTDDSNLQWNKIFPGDVLSILNLYERGKNFATLRPMREDTENWIKELEERDPLMADIFKTVQSEWKKEVKIKPKTKPKNQTIADGETTKLRTGPRPIKQVDIRICDALVTALGIAQTVDITESSKRTYLVSVRVPGKRNDGACATAGLAIALPLVYRDNLPEDAVTIVGFKPKFACGSILKINKDRRFDKALGLLYKMYSDADLVSMNHGPLGWAIREKKKYDVFINVTVESPEKDIDEVMSIYRKSLNSPETKLIHVIVSKAPIKVEHDVSSDALIINGFDPHVPWIIEAYVRGLF